MKKIIPAFIAICIVITCAISFSSCSAQQSELNDMKGSIVGNTYTIDTFDNYGNLTLKTHGQNIDIDSNIVREYQYDGENWGYVNTLSSVITITIDGHQIESCGDTCIFYDDGLIPDYDFTISNINSTVDGKLTDYTSIAKTVNSIRNCFGKPIVVVIKSQTGYPIYAFSGEDVYWTIPEKLPKFTKLMIDGKPLYIHRSNFQIIDLELIKEEE